jgi:hypothetical protein
MKLVVKGKIHPIVCRADTETRPRCSFNLFNLFATWVLEGCGWAAQRLSRFSPGKDKAPQRISLKHNIIIIMLASIKLNLKYLFFTMAFPFRYF